MIACESMLLLVAHTFWLNKYQLLEQPVHILEQPFWSAENVSPGCVVVLAFIAIACLFAWRGVLMALQTIRPLPLRCSLILSFSFEMKYGLLRLVMIKALGMLSTYLCN